MKKAVQVEQEYRRLKDNKLRVDIKGEPDYLQHLYTGNFFQKGLAFLVGRATNDSKLLKCNEAGELVVATTGSPYDTYEVVADTAVDALKGETEWSVIVSRIDIWVWDNPLNLKLKTKEPTIGGIIEIPADSFFGLDASCIAYDYQNAVAGQDSRFQLLGWS